MNQFLNELSEPVIQRSIQIILLLSSPSFVSIESAVLNESFDMNDSVSHLFKKGTCCHLLVVLLSYLLIHDRPKPAKVPAQKHIQQNIV